MSALLDLHPDTGHPAVVAVREIHDLLDDLDDASAPLAAGGYAALVADCDRAVTRLQALKLKLLAAADKAEVALDAGMPGTSAWLAAQTRAGGADAAREVRLATALDDDLPATAAALGSGALSPAHATVIAATNARLPVSLSREDRVRVEAALVAKAKRLDPVRLRKAARRALEVVERDVAVVDAHEDALLCEEETAALERTRLTLHDNHDGTVSGHFTIPTLAGAILRKAIQQLSSPRRRGAHTGPHADPDWARRQGEAFVEVLEHLPTDRLHGKVAATVVVTLDHDKLCARVGRGRRRHRRADLRGRRRGGSPAGPGSCRRSCPAPPRCSTSAAPSASSPRPNAPPSPPGTPPARPTGATDPSPGASCTMISPGPRAAGPT